MPTLFARIRTLAQSRLFRVALIGGTGVVIQTALFETLGIWLGLVPPSTAAVVGGEVAVLCNFVLNNRFSFGDRGRGALGWRLLRFHMVVAGSLLIQWLFVFTAEHATHNLLAIHGAYIAGILVGFISNYIGYTLFVWRQYDK